MPVIFASVAVLLAYLLWSEEESHSPEPLIGSAPIPKNPTGQFVKGDRVVIIGLPMSGKSYLAAKLTKDAPRVLYFDPFHDYAQTAGAVEISADALIERPTILNRSTFNFAIIPDEDDLALQLEEVVKVARAAGDLVLVLDEVGDYKREATLELEKLARNGRHNGLVPVYVSQVAMDIPRTVRRLATRVYSFRQEDKDDIDALSERYGEAFALKVSTLPLHEHALWTLPGFGPSQKMKPVTSPQSAAPLQRQGPTT